MIVRARFRAVDEPVEFKEAVSAEARMLALAYAIEESVEDGRFRSVAELARAIGVTRARMSQAMRRRWASVTDQERALVPHDGGRVL
jgi:hypothetical protein